MQFLVQRNKWTQTYTSTYRWMADHLKLRNNILINFLIKFPTNYKLADFFSGDNAYLLLVNVKKCRTEIQRNFKAQLVTCKEFS